MGESQLFVVAIGGPSVPLAGLLGAVNVLPFIVMGPIHRPPLYYCDLRLSQLHVRDLYPV